ncbi:MAG: type II CAAX endopeptidase family protein [Nitrososphaerota archaeon]|nr:CPBP family intramembrane metalloprotease [Candidatus Bathyarchaeota archaeon]MDW8194096.1 type II CAAX endopeptidase family protein [Nitrososphaerota archaeon]
MLLGQTGKRWLRVLHPAVAAAALTLFIIEYFLVYVSEAIGILFALAAALIIYGLISVLNVSDALSNALEDISILLIYIMLMAGLPWFYLSQSLLIPGVYSLVMALCFWRESAKNPAMGVKELFSHLGIRRGNLVRNCLMGLAGVPMGAVEYFILRPPPPTPHFDPLHLLQSIVYMLFFVALGEEILFRAMIQRSLTAFMTPGSSVFWSALIFAVMHTVWRSIPELFFVFAAGLLLGAIYHKTGSLVGPIAIHAVNNVMLIAVMPYLA